MDKYFYLTTTLPYVNADPHIGFALEIVQADALVRLKKLLGYQIIFNTGTDEHGQKIYQKALSSKKDPQTYCDEQVKKFEQLKSTFNLSFTHFIRTTEKKHIQAAIEFWKRCYKNGDIYKKNYLIRYCVGCELEKTDSELVNGRCPLHSNQELEEIKEENYFFRFSKYQKKLLDLYKNNALFVIPDFRLKEIISFVEKGLEDFSVSRLKNKMPWGIDVPEDPSQVMYVWFDALINYISTLGWPEDKLTFAHYWPGIQVAGKDNLRQQSAMWQAMLMSAGLPNSKQIFIHGFITADGQKMSKSLGNVVDPFTLVKKFGTDAIRYYLLKEIPSAADGNYSQARMIEIYNADLANELGNLILRITTIVEKDELTIDKFNPNYDLQLSKLFDQFEFNKILITIWENIKNLNKQVDEFAPWKKTKIERKDFMIKIIKEINQIGFHLLPLLPETGEKIITATQGKIKKMSPLFPKLI